MKVYPVNLKLTGQKCLVIGGGRVALRKIRRLLAAKATVEVRSPVIIEEIAALCRSKAVVHCDDVYRQGCLSGYFLVICATDDREINCLAAAEAKARGILVNVVNDEAAGTFTVPSSAECGSILLTASTGGKSPALARALRADLERSYGAAFMDYLTLVEQMREELKTDLPDSRSREKFWRQAICERTIELLKKGKLDEAEAELKDAVACFRAKS